VGNDPTGNDERDNMTPRQIHVPLSQNGRWVTQEPRGPDVPNGLGIIVAMMLMGFAGFVIGFRAAVKMLGGW
jgi:hypothetical protein